MEIKSDTSTFSSGTPTFNKLNMVHTIVSAIISLLLIAMSTGNMNQNMLLISGIMLLNIVLYNISQTYQTLELAQRIENDTMGYILSEKPITGPIGLTLSIITLLFLVTGNLFAWQLYIVYIILATIIGKSHKTRLGVIPKEKK